MTQRDMLVDFAPYIFGGKARRLPDALERDRARERHLRRRSSARLYRGSQEIRRPRGILIERFDCPSSPILLFRSTSTVEMVLMLFGPPSEDLMPGARNAVEVCLGIQRGEQVALIADRATATVAASIAAVLEEVGAPHQGVLIEDLVTRPMTAAPPAVARGARACRRRHSVRAAGAGRARGAHGDRLRGRAARDSLRAHGRRHAPDHAAGDARRLPAGRRVEPAPVRAGCRAPAASAWKRPAAPA